MARCCVCKEPRPYYWFTDGKNARCAVCKNGWDRSWSVDEVLRLTNGLMATAPEPTPEDPK